MARLEVSITGRTPWKESFISVCKSIITEQLIWFTLRFRELKKMNMCMILRQLQSKIHQHWIKKQQSEILKYSLISIKQLGTSFKCICIHFTWRSSEASGTHWEWGQYCDIYLIVALTIWPMQDNDRNLFSRRKCISQYLARTWRNHAEINKISHQ